MSAAGAATIDYRLEELGEIPAHLYPTLTRMQGACIYHTHAWHRVLRRAFGWRVQAVVCRGREGQILWALPFVAKHRIGFGRVNVCLPLSDHVGPLWCAGLEQDRLPRLPDRLLPMEIHADVALTGMRHESKQYGSVLDLTRYDRLDELFKATHRASIQRKVKKAEAQGLQVVTGETVEHYDAFHRLQAETRKRQGSPMHPRKFFRSLYHEMHPERLSRLHLVYLDGRAVAGVLFLHFGNQAIYSYGASIGDRDVWRAGANQLAMWSAIREAFEWNRHAVDFGASRVSQADLRTYKEKWGAASHRLAYTHGSTGAHALALERTSVLARVGAGALRRAPRAVFEQMSPWLLRAVT